MRLRNTQPFHKTVCVEVIDKPLILLAKPVGTHQIFQAIPQLDLIVVDITLHLFHHPNTDCGPY